MPDLSAEVASAHAAIDQDWAAMRDALFDLGCAEVDRLCDRLAGPDAAGWLRAAPPGVVRLVACLAGVAAQRMAAEIIEGVLDGET